MLGVKEASFIFLSLLLLCSYRLFAPLEGKIGRLGGGVVILREWGSG